MQLPHSISPARNLPAYNMLFNLFTMFIVYRHPPQPHSQLICKLHETRGVFLVCSPLYSKYLELSLTWCLIIFFWMTSKCPNTHVVENFFLCYNLRKCYSLFYLDLHKHLSSCGDILSKTALTHTLSIWALSRYKVNTGSYHTIMILLTVASIYYSMSVGLALPVHLNIKYILFYYKLISFTLHIIAKT